MNKSKYLQKTAAGANFVRTRTRRFMKIRKGFVLREMCGEHIVSAEGIDNFDFNKVISLNDSAAWLWEAVSGKDFDADTLTGLLLEKYDVERRTAAADARKLLAAWQEAGLLE